MIVMAGVGSRINFCQIFKRLLMLVCTASVNKVVNSCKLSKQSYLKMLKYSLENFLRTLNSKTFLGTRFPGSDTFSTSDGNCLLIKLK